MPPVRGQVTGIWSIDKNLFTGLLGIVGDTKEGRVILDNDVHKTDGLNWGINAERKG